MTRRAGFSARAAVELQTVHVDGYRLRRGQALDFVFHLPRVKAGERLGFGGWFCASGSVAIELDGAPSRYVLQHAEPPNWSKFGSEWVSDGTKPDDVTM